MERDLNLTDELTQLLFFSGEVATAIRMYSTPIECKIAN